MELTACPHTCLVASHFGTLREDGPCLRSTAESSSPCATRGDRLRHRHCVQLEVRESRLMRCYTALMVCIAVVLPTAAIFVLGLDCRPFRRRMALECQASVDACGRAARTANRRLTSRLRKAKEAGGREPCSPEACTAVNQKTARRVRAYWHMAAALCLLLLIELQQKCRHRLAHRNPPATFRR